MPRRKTIKHRQAYALYMDCEMTQKEVAETVGVTEKTVSKWANEGKWADIKKSKRASRDSTINQLLAQLGELNLAISQRKEGERFPTSKEADIQMKLTKQVQYLEKTLHLKDFLQVLSELTLYVKEKDVGFAKTLSDHVRDFLAFKASVEE